MGQKHCYIGQKHWYIGTLVFTKCFFSATLCAQTLSLCVHLFLEPFRKSPTQIIYLQIVVLKPSQQIERSNLLQSESDWSKWYFRFVGGQEEKTLYTVAADLQMLAPHGCDKSFPQRLPQTCCSSAKLAGKALNDTGVVAPSRSA